MSKIAWKLDVIKLHKVNVLGIRIIILHLIMGQSCRMGNTDLMLILQFFFLNKHDLGNYTLHSNEQRGCFHAVLMSELK